MKDGDTEMTEEVWGADLAALVEQHERQTNDTVPASAQTASTAINREIEDLVSQKLAQNVDDLDLERSLRDLDKRHRVGLKLIRKRFCAILADATTPAPRELTAEEIAQAEASELNRLQAEAENEELQRKTQALANGLYLERDIFAAFDKDFEKTGYVVPDNDKRFSRSTLLSHGARLLPVSSAFMFYGSSGSGKSDGVLIAAQFLPADVCLNLTSVSEQAFYYLGDIKGRYLVFGEMVPSRDGQDDYRQIALRQLISENKITRQVVEKTDGKTNVAVSKETLGPCVMVATTTREPNAWNDEFANRMSWVPTDDSEEATRAVLETQARRAVSPWDIDDEELRTARAKWRAFHVMLKPFPVAIPFAFEAKVKPNHVTARRLNALLLCYVKISALLHQGTRDKFLAGDGREYLIATLEDYKLAYEVMQSNAPRTLDIVSDAAREFFDVIRKPIAYCTMSTGQLRDVAKQPKESVRRWINELVEAGLLVQEGKYGRQHQYCLGNASESAKQDIGLISPDEVEKSFSESSSSMGNWVFDEDLQDGELLSNFN